MVHCSISISRICQPLAGLSSAETGLNGEHTIIHKLLRFYTFKMSVDTATLPELLLSSQQTVIFYLFIASRCRPGFLTLLLFAPIFFFFFTRIQFADTSICISCKVKLLATAQSLIFQDTKGSRRL